MSQLAGHDMFLKTQNCRPGK